MKKVIKLKPANEQRSKAVKKHVRISAFKARRVADLIRDRKVIDALNILRFTPTKAARILENILKSAIANAEHNYGMDTEKLFIHTCMVNEGATWKRIMPRAQGRASRIRKRTSHFLIELAEYEDMKKVAKKKNEVEASNSTKEAK